MLKNVYRDRPKKHFSLNLCSNSKNKLPFDEIWTTLKDECPQKISSGGEKVKNFPFK